MSSDRAYAIGDIHGHYDKLLAAHDLILRDRDQTGDASAPLVHIGDLVDRGPDSRLVVEHLVQGKARGENWVVLQGNHDRLFHWFLTDPHRADKKLWAGLSWLHPTLGGRETLASYGVVVTDDAPIEALHQAVLAAVPPSHRDFLASLPTRFQRGDLFFAHAGIRPGVALADQVEDDLVWIRGEFHAETGDHPALIVHGHTPIPAATHYGNRINLDSGAAFDGPLSAVVIEGRDAFLLTKAGRQRMPIEFFEPS